MGMKLIYRIQSEQKLPLYHNFCHFRDFCGTIKMILLDLNQILFNFSPQATP